MKVNIGERIKVLLEREGVTQAELCRMIGITPSRLSNYMAGKRKPSLDLLDDISKSLNSDLSFFSKDQVCMDLLKDYPEDKI